MSFEEFWLTGPWLKLGKKDAARHYAKTVKTPEDERRICLARDRYAEYLGSTEWLHPRHGSTWFNNWQEWEQFEVPQKRNGKEAIPAIQRPVFSTERQAEMDAEIQEYRRSHQK